jgi:DNA-binding beta-propeller fold protein YncE
MIPRSPKTAMDEAASPMIPRTKISCALGIALFLSIVFSGCLSDSHSPPKPPPPDDALPPLPQVLVVNSRSESISKLDLETGVMTVNATVTGAVPNRMARDAGRREILVAVSGENEIQFFAEQNLSLAGAVDVGAGSNPWEAAIWKETKAIATNWLSGKIVEIDLAGRNAGRQMQTSVSGPEGILIIGDLAYVACTHYQSSQTFLDGQLDVIDLASWKRIASIPVALNPQDVKEGPDGRLHVLCTGNYGTESGKVTVVDPVGFATQTIELGGSPGRVAMGGGGIAWIAGDQGGVRRYDARSLEVFPPLEDPALSAPGFSAVAWDSAGGTVYAASFEADLLIAIDESSLAIRDAWIVGDGPVDVLVLR